MAQTEKRVEGTLDIFWENNAEPRSTPKYRLLFVPYRNFRNGAQPAKYLASTEALKSYLIQISFSREDADERVKQLNEKKSVSIPNVFLTERFLAEYE